MPELVELLDASITAESEPALQALVAVRALPIWQKQVETARTQMEDSIRGAGTSGASRHRAK
jgi:hypothetical protein